MTARPLMTREEVEQAVAVANVPVLLMVVFQVTGDERWLDAPYLPTRGRGLGDHDDGGLPADVQREIRDAAVLAIEHLMSGHPPVVAVPSAKLMTRMLSVCIGERVKPEYGEMFSVELALRYGALDPEPPIPDVPADFTIAVIGAGVAGLAATHQLDAAGLDYVMIDQLPAPGGNWWLNTYPGAGVDTPSHLYSFSFAPHDWSMHFELRDSLQDYFAEVAATVKSRHQARFETHVDSAVWDDHNCKWDLTLRTKDGGSEQLSARIVISATGALNRPKFPDVPGKDSFEGPSFHSSCWPENLDLAGQRVAVIGAGASAMQIAPAIADQVDQLVIFQRSPQWIAPFEKFMQPIPSDLRLLLKSCDLYRAWYWLKLFWQFGDKVIESLRKDPQWPHPERSVNARNDGHRAYFTRYIRERLGSRNDLIAKSVPHYPPYGKRILLDNGWYDTILKDNVTLVAEGVEEVRPNSVVSASGAEHHVDVVVWATGFDAARLLSGLEVVGVDGVRLREVWDDDNPRAFLGMTVPGFPNFYLLGGPNSFPGSGSFMYFMEIQMRYIRRLMTEMLEKDLRALDTRRERFEWYTQLVDSEQQNMVWSHPGMTTYYRNARGRVVYVMPFLNVDYWYMTRKPDLTDYVGRT